MSRSCKRDPVPYHANPDTPLLSFGGEFWRIRDAYESVAIFGAPGSGKTSGSMRAILKATVAAGFGGVFLCGKSDAADEIRHIANEAGRSQDLAIFDATEGSHKTNILDAARAYQGDDQFGQGALSLMSKMIEANRRASGTGGSADSENRYFTDGALKWLSHAMALLQPAYGTLRMRDIDRFIASTPQSLAEIKSEEWKPSFCYRTLAILAAKAKQAAESGCPDVKLERVIRDHGDFFLDEAAKLDNRPRSSLTSTISNMLYPFLTGGKLGELFCTSTTITPMAAREGKLLVLDIPPLVFGPGGAVAQVLFKHLFGVAMQSKTATKDTRPVFIAADEAELFLDSGDADLLALSRSQRICTMMATQDLPTYYAKLGANARDVAESILSKFGTRIFHANTSRETNQAAAELIGNVEKFHLSETRSRGRSVGEGDNQHDWSGGSHGSQGANVSSGQSTSGYMDYAIPPDFFATKLRTGGRANGFKADAIVVRTARTWKGTGRHWTLAEFSQR